MGFNIVLVEYLTQCLKLLVIMFSFIIFLNFNLKKNNIRYEKLYKKLIKGINI